MKLVKILLAIAIIIAVICLLLPFVDEIYKVGVDVFVPLPKGW